MSSSDVGVRMVVVVPSGGSVRRTGQPARYECERSEVREVEMNVSRNVFEACGAEPVVFVKCVA